LHAPDHWIATCVVALAACAGDPPAFPTVRFANQPIVWTVNDHRDTRARPTDTVALIKYDFYYRSFQHPITKSLELRRARRARGVNALDEVPDSTWFTNRIGTQALTPAQVAAGPTEPDGPEAHKPWTIRSTKYGGASAGMIITDARGVKFLLKFEPPGLPELTSGADAVTSRLLWAAGYNVPENYVVYFRPEDLVLAPDAVVKDPGGGTRRALDHRELAEQLAGLDRTADGRMRGLASRWLDGTILGTTADEGVRDDDPNDKIPHELRRDLRGAYAIFEWVDNVDLQAGNAVDVLVRDPDGTHHVQHVRVDFDDSLGVMAMLNRALRFGYTNSFDWSDMLGETVTLGFGHRPWLERYGPRALGVSPAFTADAFDPGAWKPDIPVAAFDGSDRFDQYWGAKIVARFSREQIRAAVEAGRYSDPRTIDYITGVLVARQRAVVAYWISRVSALEHVTASGRGMCFDDLAIQYGLASPSTTQYRVISRDRAGQQLGEVVADAHVNGSTCLATLPLAADHDEDYTILEIITTRPGATLTQYVHVARDPATGEPRVIGVWRV
jgi:hypothetical protein